LRRLAGVIPLTATGALALVLCAVGYFLARKWLDMVVFMAAAVGVVLTALMIVLVLIAVLAVRSALRAERAPTPLRLETEAWQDTGFALPFSRWLPLVEVSWTWADARADICVERRGGLLVERALPRRRGWHDGVGRRITVRDVVALSGVSWEHRERASLHVLPSIGMLGRLTPLRRFAAGDDVSDPFGEPFGDRVDMRQYVRGDSPRMILWKVYARSRKLMVRIPERAVVPLPRACAYLVVAAADEPAAAMARVLVERSLLGNGWRFGVDGVGGFAESADPALRMICASGNLEPAEATGQGLEAFLAQASHDGYASCLLLLPPLETPALERVLHVCARAPMPVTCCLVVDGVETRPSAARRWERWLLQPESRPACPLEMVGALASRWPGHDLLLVDRLSGQVIEDLRGLATLKAAAR